MLYVRFSEFPKQSECKYGEQQRRTNCYPWRANSNWLFGYGVDAMTCFFYPAAAAAAASDVRATLTRHPLSFTCGGVCRRSWDRGAAAHLRCVDIAWPLCSTAAATNGGYGYMRVNTFCMDFVHWYRGGWEMVAIASGVSTRNFGVTHIAAGRRRVLLLLLLFWVTVWRAYVLVIVGILNVWLMDAYFRRKCFAYFLFLSAATAVAMTTPQRTKWIYVFNLRRKFCSSLFSGCSNCRCWIFNVHLTECWHKLSHKYSTPQQRQQLCIGFIHFGSNDNNQRSTTS